MLIPFLVCLYCSIGFVVVGFEIGVPCFDIFHLRIPKASRSAWCRDIISLRVIFQASFTSAIWLPNSFFLTLFLNLFAVFCVCCFHLQMAGYSSGESYKQHSPSKASVLGELHEAQRTIRRLEEKLHFLIAHR